MTGRGDERAIARWVGSNERRLLLTTGPRGTRLYERTALRRTYHPVSIVAGRKRNGSPTYSDRPTLEYAQAYAEANGYEQVYP